MDNIRIDFEGLIAYVFRDKETAQATSVTAVFSDPWRFGLHPHHPYLEVTDANSIDWANTSLGVVPNRTPLSFDLAGWNIQVLPDGRAPATEAVSLPSTDTLDPDSGGEMRQFSGMNKLLDLMAICGANRVKAEYYGNPSSDKLMGRVALTSGTARTVSDLNAVFELWQFGPPVNISQAAAPIVAWKDTVTATLQLALQSLKDPAITATIQLLCPSARLTRVAVKHTCVGHHCGPMRGHHIPAFYDMVEGIKYRPKASPPLTEGGYCPPSGLEA